MTTYRQLIKRSQDLINKNNLDEKVIFMILEDRLNLPLHQILLNIDNEVSEKFLEEFSEYFSAYLIDDKPIAYVLGYTYFYNFKLKVNENVLIPRKETEEVVEAAIKLLQNKENLSIADIGTGSGNIAIALSKNLNTKKIYGLDISNEALKIARENAISNDAIIEFNLSDSLSYLLLNKIKVDVIISNPPYIDKDYKLDKSVKDYEPSLALFADNKGLFYYEQILKDAKKVLNDKGFIVFEIGFDQKDAIKESIKKYLPEAKYEIKKDLGKNDRIVLISL